MNKKQVFALSFFIGGTFFLGFGYSLLCHLAGKDSWICLLLGVLLGSGVIYILEKLKHRKEEGINKYKKLNNIIFFLFNLFLYSQLLFGFQTFASSFFLIKSPNWFITLPIPFILYKIAQAGVSTIGKVSEILFPITLVLFSFTFLGLFEHFDFNAFTPILTTSWDGIIKGTLLVMTYSTIPFFLLLNIPLEKNKLLKGYLFCEIFVFLNIFFVIAVLGPNLIQIYRYPEYMILKEIKIFNFIEKVENISSIAWLFNLFVLLSLTGYNLKECLPKKKNNILFAVLLGIMYIGTVAESYFYPNELLLYHLLPYIFLGIGIIIIVFTFFSVRKKI